MLRPAVNTKLLIPIDLCSFVAANGFYKTFELYIYLKCQSSGKIRLTSDKLNELKDINGWKDSRTIQKHLKKLKKLDWIGFSHKSQTYFVRSFKSLQRKHRLYKRKSSVFYYSKFESFSEFVDAALMCGKISGIKFSYEVARRLKLNTAPKKKDGASQCYVYDDKPIEYCGLSNKGISELLFCSPTTACDKKHAAENCGFIKTKERLEKVIELARSDYALRAELEELNPGLKGKLIFRRITNKIFLFRQLHDEIIPLIKFKNRKKIAGKILESSVKGPLENSSGGHLYLRQGNLSKKLG